MLRFKQVRLYKRYLLSKSLNLEMWRINFRKSTVYKVRKRANSYFTLKWFYYSKESRIVNNLVHFYYVFVENKDGFFFRFEKELLRLKYSNLIFNLSFYKPVYLFVKLFYYEKKKMTNWFFHRKMVIPHYSIINYFMNDRYNMVYWGLSLPSYMSINYLNFVLVNYLIELNEEPENDSLEEVDDNLVASSEEYFASFNYDIATFSRHFNNSSPEWNFFLYTFQEFNCQYYDLRLGKLEIERTLKQWFTDTAPAIDKKMDSFYRVGSINFLRQRVEPDDIDIDDDFEDDEDDKDDNE